MLYSDLNLFIRDESSINFRASSAGSIRRAKAITSKSPFLIYDLNSIKQSVLTILSTNKGSRIFLPEFGCNIMKYLFRPVDTTGSKNIENEIYSALTNWEKRIDIVNIEVLGDVENQQYYVLIEYDIPSLRLNDNVSFNLRSYS